MPYPNFHAARVILPDEFKNIVVLKKLDNGIMIYGGKLKTDNKTATQSYRLPRDKFTATQARTWLKDNNIKTILFEPATGTGKKDMKESKNIDFTLDIDLKESKVNSDSRRIHNVVILSQISRDKDGNVRRRYTNNALMTAVNALEGAGACVAHLKHDKSRERDVTEYFGVYNNLKIVKDISGMGKVVGTLNIFECEEGNHILDIAEKAPHLCGNSIHAGGKGYMENGVEVIEELLPLTRYGNKPSIDTVTNPATTINLFEDNNNINPEDDNNNNNNGDNKMKIDLMEATVDNIKTSRPDIVAHFDKSAEIKELTESVEKLTKENKELAEKVDVFEAQSAVIAKQSLADSLIKKANLAPELVTDTFRESLLDVTESTGADGKAITVEEKMKAIINDRAALKLGVKNMGGNSDIFESARDGSNNNSTKDLKPRDIVRIFKCA